MASESALRRGLDRLGYGLRKKRGGGYFIVDTDINGAVAGDPSPAGDDMELEDVAAWLTDARKAAGEDLSAEILAGARAC